MENIKYSKKPNVDFIGNINNLEQFDNESCEEIYASHIIEHVDQKTILKTLKGINRILIKNGKLYISVPDIDTLCHFYYTTIR